ncbi:2-oxoacid:acceptor oxidoreductase family protein [Desulfobotulus sp. H1]|uniref:2-oxoacid:acceptor oxidoreductase family protein n=1 Tax=Desulfobotulus pelophilus TaxID=2823377 RepID=A0ABT3N7Q1_9BACT|nr:2-oxoacid:acceptor oxidoreductase family protein [Desulfobotulus pelophilus]MCW7753483.1 2-oxoacid:acceptor oxidoreductase family protein [Desulfobotulus pelophilus]
MNATERVFIRMSGLGGQGAVTAAHILGSAANKDGLESTVNPFFGAEKRLAPAESYVRISSEKVYEKGEVLYPNIIMIFHPHVITMGKCYTMPFFDGLQEGGSILINADEPLVNDEDLRHLADLKAKIYYVPATGIATKVAGSELSTNIAMLGGLYAMRKLTSMEALKESMIERFGGGKFVASGTTAALDDAVTGKFAKVSQMIEKNMELIAAAGAALTEFPLPGTKGGE